MTTRRVSILVHVCALAALLLPPTAAAQTAGSSSYKLAFFNIKSGKGQIALPGFPTTFADTDNCTDASLPRNAWGVGAVQAELISKVVNDPKVISLGLAEAWNCANPVAVKNALGWNANSSEHNGVAIVARYGFAGPEQWTQLDTSLNSTPADTMWVLRTPVCVDAACSDSVIVFTAHWYGSGATNWATNTEYETQAQQTIDFLNLVPGTGPQVLIGDLNVFSGTQVVCGQNPRNAPPRMLRDAGYLDAWTSLNGPADGFTGMWNRAGCGTPNGYLWKRIDYSWSRGMSPLSMVRFGMVAAGQEATSDHAGIIVEYPLPKALAASVPPVVSIRTPAAGATITGSTVISIDAIDDVTVQRVELLIDGEVVAVLPAAPYDYSWSTAAVPNGVHTLSAAATDSDGNRVVSPAQTVTVQNPVAAGDEIVLYAGSAAITGTDWSLVADANAAGGSLVQNPDRARAAVTTAAASPASYVEWAFTPTAGKPYRLWIRGRAQSDSATNDAVFAQFTGTTDASGAAIYRIGSTSATSINLEDCEACGLSGWGWQDNGWPRDVLGPVVYFTGTGPQRIRLQVMEDGLGIDQIVLSSLQYLKTAPGAVKNDTTIVPLVGTTSTTTPPPNVAPVVALSSPASGTSFTAPATVTLQATASDSDNGVARVEFYSGTTLLGTSTTSPYAFTWTSVPAGSYSLTARAVDTAGAATTSAAVAVTVQAATTTTTTTPITEVVLYASRATPIAGDWAVIADATAAGGSRIQNPNFAAAKITTALANPASYFELTFNADAGTPYRLWLRGKALNDDFANDSIFVQFDHSVDANGAAIDRIGTTSAEVVVIENCGGCGLSGWGWQDNAYGLGALGNTIVFAQSGPQRIRFQVREDGLGLDQVVLSAVKYITTSPGATKNDTTILPETSVTAASANVPPVVAITSPAANASFTAPASIALAASASDSDGGVTRVDFYAGSTLVGSAATSPYAASWTGATAGTYSITARATDTAGAVTTSAPVTIQVTAPAPANAAPTVTLTSPVNNSSFTAGTSIVVAATAADSDGTIAKVEFYAGSKLIGTATGSPYAVTWTNAAMGSYSVTARAYDNAGASTTSAAITVHIKKR